jgi:hypothetical protein
MANVSTSADDKSLLSAAESRIDAAMSRLILSSTIAREASQAQQIAVTELREARDAIRLLRDRLG